MNQTNELHKVTFPQLIQWASRPADFLEACTKSYGDNFTLQFPGDCPVIFVSHPQAIEDVLTAPTGTFVSGQGNEMFRPIMGNHSLLMLDGKPHQRQRKLMMPAFHGERMRLYGTHICELASKITQTWQVGESFQVSACMEKITVNALVEVVFGLREGERSAQLRQNLLALVELSASPLIALHLFFPPLRKNWGAWSPWGRLMRLKQDVDRLIYAEIAHRRQQPQPERTDILSLLMAACDEQGERMSDRELRDELITLVLAGFDTTSTALTWAMYWIHKEPRVGKRLLAELDTVGDPSNTKAVTKLPYLSATCQEALRIYPIIVLTFIRVAQTPFKIMGTEFPAGMRVWPNIYSAHHRQEVYREPDRFQPERFLNHKYSAYEYLPFGGGNRLCVGQAFASFLMKLVLFTILTRYQLMLANSRPLQPVRHGPGLAPSGAVRLRVAAHRYRPSQNVVLSS